MAKSSGSGAKGDFSATPLASAGSWAAGSSSGGFSYTYQLQPPTVPGGPAPNPAFGYNSQGVDGRTSASNNQASWIGDGWDYNPGPITRTYRSCRDDTSGVPAVDGHRAVEGAAGEVRDEPVDRAEEGGLAGPGVADDQAQFALRRP